MTQDHASEGAFQAIGEKQRTPEFKDARATLVGDIQKLYEAYQLGMVREWGNFRMGKTNFGMPAVIVKAKEEGNVTDRTIGYDDVAFKQYADVETYVPEGQTSVVASFEDITFNETTREFERIGWIVRGNGSVERLLGETRDDGEFVWVGKATNDVMDLQLAHDFLVGIQEATILPEPTA